MNFRKELNAVAKIKLNEWNGKSKIEVKNGKKVKP